MPNQAPPQSYLAWRLYSSEEKIPRGYDSYTFFLSPSYKYLHQTTDQTLLELEESFARFAKLIKDNNLAVLPTSKISPNKINVAISKDLIDRIAKRYSKLNLSYNNGPYIIVLNHHPESSPLKTDAASVIRFNMISPAHVYQGLNYIEQGIRQNNLFEDNATFTQNWLVFISWLDTVDAVAVKNIAIEFVQAFRGGK